MVRFAPEEPRGKLTTQTAEAGGGHMKAHNVQQQANDRGLTRLEKGYQGRPAEGVGARLGLTPSQKPKRFSVVPHVIGRTVLDRSK